jgi:BirA family transcriptional regulator, biotin operon repressor / biotin---[acetyl-CoA-carboxylase] ligase
VICSSNWKVETRDTGKTLTANRFRLTELRKTLRPFRLHWFSTLRSTNDHAAVMRRAGELYAPAIVLTGRQTAGRGRGAHAWWSGAGCLTVTFVLPVDDQLLPYQIPLLAGLAVRNAAAELSGSKAIALKWPNDLLFEDRKLGGLLCERIEKADLVGLGLNVNLDRAAAPRDLRASVASLAEIRGKPLDMTGVIATVAAHLHRLWSRGAGHPFGAVLQEYDTHHALVGRRVSVVDGGELPVSGRCEGLDAMGRLMLRSRSKLQRIVCGHVQLI